MSKRQEKIDMYAQDLRDKCGMEPDMDLLEKVVIACGPTIYNRDSETVATSDTGELNTIKQNWLIKKLGLPDDEHLMGGIQSVTNTYGRSNTRKYRAVMYYLLTVHFGKEDAL